MNEPINWLPLWGGAEIRDNIITYIPETFVNEIDGKTDYKVTTLASNKYFDNGEISFKCMFTDQVSRVQIVLNSLTTIQPVYITLNTVGAYGVFKLKDSMFEALTVNGTQGSFKINTFYDIKINVIGSQIKLYVNGILVSSAEHIIKKSQIQMVFYGPCKVIVKDFSVITQKAKAFVVMQFTEEYNQLFREVIKPVCESFDLECIRADECFSLGSIIEDIISSIKESFIIIADITPNNPNVFYEVGYAHAINKPTILLSDKKRDKLPFDLSSFRTLFYDNTIVGKSAIESKLKRYLEEITLSKSK